MTAILIVGATGNVGRPLTAQLVEQGFEVLAASRNGRSVAGATGVPFDYAEPGRFAAISSGVDVAYLMMPTGYPDGIGTLSTILEVARDRGIRIVLHTALETRSDRAHHAAPLEDLLMSSRVNYAIMRPGWYMQNFLHFWSAQMSRGLLELPAGDGRMSLVDVRDIAASAAAVLVDEKLSDRVFHITGARAYSFAEALQVLSVAADRTLKYRSVSQEEMIRRSIADGQSPREAEFFVAAYKQIRCGNTALVTDDVEMLTGRPPRRLTDYAAEIRTELREG